MQALLTAFRAKGDFSGLTAVWSSPINELSAADWDAIKQYSVVTPKKCRGRTGEHRTLLTPVLHLAHLDYLDQRDLLAAEKKAAAGVEAERQRIEDLEASLVEIVAREWREGQQVLNAAEGLAEGERWVKDQDGNDIPPPKKSVAKDRLVTEDNLQLVIDGDHNALQRMAERERAAISDVALPLCFPFTPLFHEIVGYDEALSEPFRATSAPC